MMVAISEGFLEHFEELVDPRVDNANRRHELGDMLVLTILAVICGADNWVEIEAFGQSKFEELKRFLPLPHGIPSHDTLGDVFARWVQPVFRSTCPRVLKWWVPLSPKRGQR